MGRVPWFGSLLAEAEDTRQWCEDWREGMFTPARTSDGWTVEMHGLVESAEKLSRGVQRLADELEQEKAGRSIERDALRALPADYPVGKALDLMDHLADAGRRAGEAASANSQSEPSV